MKPQVSRGGVTLRTYRDGDGLVHRVTAHYDHWANICDGQPRVPMWALADEPVITCLRCLSEPYETIIPTGFAVETKPPRERRRSPR